MIMWPEPASKPSEHALADAVGFPWQRSAVQGRGELTRTQLLQVQAFKFAFISLQSTSLRPRTTLDERQGARPTGSSLIYARFACFLACP